MACILTWKPKTWPEMQSYMDDFHSGKASDLTWKCGACRMFGPGDRVFVSKTGQDNPGLIGSGFIVSKPFQEEDFDTKTKMVWCVKVRFDYLLKSAIEVVVSHEQLSDLLSVSKKAFTPRKSGTSYPGDSEELEHLWQQLTSMEAVYPDEVGVLDGTRYKEGAVREVKVNRYERDYRARQACISYYGTNCKACGMNLNEVYGKELAKDFVHVHHLLQLKDIGEEDEVDPVKDLVPLCPNCPCQTLSQPNS